MRTIFILMDSLNRHYLNSYGTSWIQTPNVDRLARQGTVFENHYCGSLPCMPARREMMTGKLNFLETPWGPIEPWDDCLPVLLRRKYYHDVIRKLLDAKGLDWKDLAVAGDIFELDLALPLALGARVALLRNAFTPDYEQDFLQKHPRGQVLHDVSEIPALLG